MTNHRIQETFLIECMCIEYLILYGYNLNISRNKKNVFMFTVKLQRKMLNLGTYLSEIDINHSKKI